MNGSNGRLSRCLLFLILTTLLLPLLLVRCGGLDVRNIGEVERHAEKLQKRGGALLPIKISGPEGFIYSVGPIGSSCKLPILLPLDANSIIESPNSSTVIWLHKDKILIAIKIIINNTSALRQKGISIRNPFKIDISQEVLTALQEGKDVKFNLLCTGVPKEQEILGTAVLSLHYL